MPNPCIFGLMDTGLSLEVSLNPQGGFTAFSAVAHVLELQGSQQIHSMLTQSQLMPAPHLFTFQAVTTGVSVHVSVAFSGAGTVDVQSRILGSGGGALGNPCVSSLNGQNGDAAIAVATAAR